MILASLESGSPQERGYGEGSLLPHQVQTQGVWLHHSAESQTRITSLGKLKSLSHQSITSLGKSQQGGKVLVILHLHTVTVTFRYKKDTHDWDFDKFYGIPMHRDHTTAR